MSGQAQVDYDALADQARKPAASAPPAATSKKKKAQPAIDYDALAAQSRQAQEAPSAAPDLTTNSINPATGTGYGLYRMGSYDYNQGQVTKPEIQVPYNRVADAQAAGYSLHPDEAPRYQNDTAHNGSVSRATGQVKSLLSRMTEPMPDRPLNGTPFQNAAAALTNVGQIPFNVVNRTVRGVAGLPQGVALTAVDAIQGNPEGLDPFAMGENSYKNLQQDTANLGPVAALSNLGGDAATMYATGKLGSHAIEVGTEPMMKVVRGVRNAPEFVARVATGTGKGPVEELVKQRQLTNEGIDKANALTDKAHSGDIQDALHDQHGREIGYQKAVDSKTQEIAQADQSEAGQLAAKQSAADQKIAAANESVKAKHQAVAQKVAEANRAAKNALELRRQHEQTYQKATTDHYAKEQAADTQAKAEENSAWSGWRQKTAGKTLDGGLISDPLQKLRLDSPEVDRTLNQLEPRGDEVPQESPYTQIRAQAAQQQFGKDYESLSPVKQDEVDDLLHSNGYSPDPIAFDPQKGQPISIDRVQRASSILQRYIRSGRFEGPLLGEMKQVAKVLRNAVTRASADAGAAPELDAARNSTVTYQNAFGRERNTPATARTVREKQINPEAFQERVDEERLARARRYDPTLVDSYRQVKAAREALDKLPPEDQLRKSLRQVPPPPTVNDPRPGFRLTAPPQRTPARLTSGSPAERAFQSVEQPPRPNFPDRPIPDPHQTISAGDITAAYKAAAEASAGKWWSRGRWAAAAPVIWAMRGFFGGHIPPLLTTGLESGGILAASHAAASLLRYPPMIEFLTKARPEDTAMIPPELRGDLPGLVSQAQHSGIKVSPALIAMATGVAVTGQKREQSPIPVAQALQAMQPAQMQGAHQ